MSAIGPDFAGWESWNHLPCAELRGRTRRELSPEVTLPLPGQLPARDLLGRIRVRAEPVLDRRLPEGEGAPFDVPPVLLPVPDPGLVDAPRVQLPMHHGAQLGHDLRALVEPLDHLGRLAD